MPDPSTYDVTTAAGQVRLLLNDVAAPWVFTDAEIEAFLALAPDGNVKRAASRVISTNALNEALASKVITTQDVATDGAKLAAAMKALADGLTAEADADEAAAGYFEIVDTDPHWCHHSGFLGY